MHRLEALSSQANTMRANHLHYKLKVQIEEAIAEIALAACKSMNRATNIYQSASNECTAYIGSLVDQRIKLSNSLKYLHRQIPTVLATDVGTLLIPYSCDQLLI